MSDDRGAARVGDAEHGEYVWPDLGTWFGALLASFALSAALAGSLGWAFGIDATAWWLAWLGGGVVLYMGSAYVFRNRTLGKVLLGIGEFVWFLCQLPF